MKFYYSDIIYQPTVYTFLASPQSENMTLLIEDVTTKSIKFRHYFKSTNEFLFSNNTYVSNILNISEIEWDNCNSQLSYELKLVKQNGDIFNVSESSSSIILTDVDFSNVNHIMNNIVSQSSVFGTVGDYIELTLNISIVPTDINIAYHISVLFNLATSILELINIEPDVSDDVSVSCDDIEFYVF